MEPAFLAVAFVLGLAARQVALPPLVGFLAAGFALKGFGFESGPLLHGLADLGVILLLFSIGLKLKVETLLRPEIWAGASLHMALIVVVFGLVIFTLGAAGVHFFAGLDLATSALVAEHLPSSGVTFHGYDVRVRGDKSGDPELIAILAKARVERNVEARKKLVHEAHQGEEQQFPGIVAIDQLLAGFQEALASRERDAAPGEDGHGSRKGLSRSRHGGGVEPSEPVETVHGVEEEAQWPGCRLATSTVQHERDDGVLFLGQHTR